MDCLRAVVVPGTGGFLLAVVDDDMVKVGDRTEFIGSASQLEGVNAWDSLLLLLLLLFTDMRA